MNDIQLDQPVSQKIEDAFQRYEFAKRIAGIINIGSYSKALVIGIYGKWGEGKSSVLNFIEKETNKKSLTINFNPWYFQEDNLIIKSFFESIAAALGKKLKNKKDEIIKTFEDYGDSLGTLANLVLPFGSSVVSAGKKIVSTFKNDSLEHYKSRVVKLINSANVNIAVFIDDIDRLNIDEIQSVFKLVKLVGDFPRVSYIMAFDDELVAASLGHKFGKREIKDGYDFLEKIIQLPLTLPKASRYSLRKYCLDQIEKSLKDLKIQLTESASQDFLGKFDGAFLPGLKNPRLAVRFANAISFAMPLLHGEVNLSDLMIVEGIKVFYPNLYYLIRSQPDLFLNSYQYPNPTDVKHKQNAKDRIDAELTPYGNELSFKIREMLWSLFPQLNGLYNNFFSGSPIIESWYRNKKLCSTYYFHRYFSYAIMEGEISDVYFKELFADVEKKKPADLSKILMEELKKLDLQMFIYKLKHLAFSFNIPEVENLYIVLSMLGRQIPIQQRFEISPPEGEMAVLIKILISRLNRETRLNHCKRSIDVAEPMSFTLALYRVFSDKKKRLQEEIFLTAEEEKELDNHLIEKYLAEKERFDVFTKYTEEELYLIFDIFDQQGRKSEINADLTRQLNNPRTPGFSLKIIRIFTPTHYSTIVDHPFKSVFSKENYYQLKNFIDPVLVYNNLISTHGQTRYVPEKQFTPGDECSDPDLMILFQEIHNEINKGE